MSSPQRSPEIDFKAVFESAPGLILVLTPELRVAVASEAYLRAIRRPREAIVGRALAEIFPDDPEEPGGAWGRNLRASLDRVNQTRQADAMEVQRYDLRRPEDGTLDERHWSAVNAPVFDAAGKIAYIVHHVEDVTVAQRRERALQRANEELRAASEKLATSQAALYQAQKMEAVGQLTGGVAHDFNNLLTVIIGNVDLLESEAGRDQQMLKLIATIRRSAERGARLTTQLLAFSRRQTLRPEACNLNSLIIDLDVLIKRALGEAIEVRTSFNPGLWPVNVDAAQFEASILNLVVNARDAMPEGGNFTIETHNTTLDAEAARLADVRPGQFVMLSFSDTGAGMTPEVLERAFEPFYTTKEVGKGSGLGLSQLYGFVRQSGGHATIESAPGRGTTVRIYLPVAMRQPAPAQPAAKPATKLRGSETVLVVEDDPDVLDVAVATLGDLGYRILVAHDGIEALHILARDEPIDLLFTDVVMPHGVSGIQLARQARKLRQDIKVLLTSGYTVHTVSPEYGAEREFPIIGKPYRQAELAEQVRRALGRAPQAGG
ncbi:MAG TPA: ATP-binding protein [Stellaceae bacterium]|nr:ATP-binding protein [Stellaceae bacterium]